MKNNEFNPGERISYWMGPNFVRTGKIVYIDNDNMYHVKSDYNIPVDYIREDQIIGLCR